MSTYNIRQFSEITGLAVKTLQRWDREGRLSPNRTLSNRRVYTEEHLAQALGMTRRALVRKTVVYARVSSQAQKPDLDNQVQILEQFCSASGITVDEWVREIGGGLNFKRRKFTQLIDQISRGQIEQLIIAHQDRLARFGFDLVEHLCQLNGCRLTVMNNESLSPEPEMVQDMLSIVHGFSARLYGLRHYRKSLKQALEDDTGA